MLFQDYVSRLVNIFGRPELAVEKDADGHSCCRLVLTEELVMVFTALQDHDVLLTTCEVGPLPTENRETVLQQLLADNFMYEGTHGATLAADVQKNAVLLCRHEDLARIDADRIENTVANFASDALKYHEQLSGQSEGDAAASPQASSKGYRMMRV